MCISMEISLSRALDMQPLLVNHEMGDSLRKSKDASVKELLIHVMQECNYAKMRCTI